MAASTVVVVIIAAVKLSCRRRVAGRGIVGGIGLGVLSYDARLMYRSLSSW